MNASDLVTVYAEATPNPESMKFVTSRNLIPNDSRDFRNAESTAGHPLPEALFALPFVKGVFIMNNFISITKNSDYEWFDLVPDLRNFVIEWLQEGKEIVGKPVTLTLEQETEIETKIRQLLEDHVRPAVEMDGGAIDFKSFKDGVVTVEMKGSCSGCPSSTMTLKAGIENLLKRMVPEVQAVEAEAV